MERTGGWPTPPKPPHVASKPRETPLKRTLRAILPGLLVLGLAMAALWAAGDEDLSTITSRYALVLYVAGAALATFFRRSRIVVALVALAFTDAAAHRSNAAPHLLLPLGTALVALFGLLALTWDRRARSRGGVVQFLVAAVLLGSTYVVFRDPLSVAAFRRIQVIPVGALSALQVPQVTIVVGAAAVLAAAYGAIRWRGPVERALVWSQFFVLASFDPTMNRAESSLLFMAAGLMLSLSVLEHSYSMAYRDELTGLPTRRALMEYLAEIGGRYTLAMVDVDHFKRFNDTYGHDVGDQVLKLVGSRLSAGPGGGMAYRYGGEEFTLVYPGRVSEAARPHAEAVRASVEKARFSLRAWDRPRKKKSEAEGASKRAKPPRDLSVTVSIGLGDSSSGVVPPEEVLRKADEALYRAKSLGRNRVVI